MLSQTSLTINPAPLKNGLYIVATPIGNLQDITLRALTTLASVKLIACEDTRHTGKLLHHFGIRTKMEPYHDHNGAEKRPELIALAANHAVALVSDAGTPLISDPGYKLVREAAVSGVHVEAVPGASSVIAALCVAGLPTDRFLFEGFLPTTASQARAALSAIAGVQGSLIFFESAKRLSATLALMHEVLGAREACVARELTKLHEEAVRGTLATLAAHYASAIEPKGEIVIIIGPPVKEVLGEEALDAALRNALSRLSVKDAVAEVSSSLSLSKSRVYARALALKDGA